MIPEKTLLLTSVFGNQERLRDDSCLERHPTLDIYPSISFPSSMREKGNA